MVLYTCELCNKNFNKKSNFLAHKNKKFTCFKPKSDLLQAESNLIQQNAEIQLKDMDANYNCNYCNKKFTFNCNLLRHMRERCKVKKEMDNEKEQIFAQLIDDMEKVKQQNLKLINKINKIEEKSNKRLNKVIKINNDSNNNTIINSNNTTNNTINNTINNKITINLVAHGKEKLNYITDKKIIEFFNDCFKSVQSLVEYVHFNVDKPEYSNVYISNILSKYAMKYNGTQWIICEKDLILHELYNDKSDFLIEKFDEMIDTLDEDTIKRFKKFLSQADNTKVINNIKKDVMMILYNNKEIPEQIKNIGIK